MTTRQPGTLVDHAALRQAVGQFAARPDQRGALNVLRECMYGELLLDITGSDPIADGVLAAGSRLQIRTGTGPDGGSALFAFTRNAEIARLHSPQTHTQSLANPAVAVLEFARAQEHAWLYIDPAGPTCALSAAEIDFALRNPNHAELKEALARHAAGDIDRAAVAAVLRPNSPLLVAVTGSPGAETGIRTFAHADGATSALAFSSAPEVLAFSPADAVAALTAEQVLDTARRADHAGIVVNPAGPSIRLSLTEIAG